MNKTKKVIPEEIASSTISLKAVIGEKLYDLQGRNAFNTVPVEKGAYSKYPGVLGFEKDFVVPRNPARSDGEDFWRGQKMDGRVADWVDSTVYSSDDVGYAYSGFYYEKDPTARQDKASGPGAQFQSTSSHTLQYRYGQYENLPRSNVSAKDITLLFNKILPNLSTAKVANLYTLKASISPLSDSSVLTNVSVTELSGQDGISLLMDASGRYLMQNTTSLTQAKMGHTGVPVLGKKDYLQPNAYDDSGNIQADDTPYFQNEIEVTALGQKTYVYTLDGWDTFSYYDEGGLLRFTRDAAQQSLGICLYYIYDGQGRLTQVYGLPMPEWNVETLQAYLNQTQPLPPQSQLVRQYTYNAIELPKETCMLKNTQGRLVMMESWNVQSNLMVSENTYVKELYTYNDQGRLSSTQVSNQQLASICETKYVYKASGQLESIIYPAAFRSAGKEVAGIIYTYNTQGKVTQVGRLYTDGTTDPAFYARYTYNANGTIDTEALARGKLIRTYTYNVLNQVTQITDSSSFFTEMLSYMNAQGKYQDGNIQTAAYTLHYGDEKAASYTYQYEYDSFGRLQSAQSNMASMPSWQLGPKSYDANGNIHHDQDGTNTYARRSNRLEESSRGVQYTYTPSGCTETMTRNGQVTSFAYTTDLLRPISVGDTQIIYDGKGERLHKKTNSISIQYARQGGSVLQENVSYTSSGNTYQLSYIYGPTGVIAVEIESVGMMPGDSAESGTTYDGTYMLIKDVLGSTRAVFNSDTGIIVAYMNYSPWGAIVSGNSSLGVGAEKDDTLASLFRYLYTGQEWDPDMGLYNYHARQYDPALSRFLSPDLDNQTPSPYTYCGNNPINKTDPTGNFFLGNPNATILENDQLPPGLMTAGISEANFQHLYTVTTHTRALPTRPDYKYFIKGYEHNQNSTYTADIEWSDTYFAYQTPSITPGAVARNGAEDTGVRILPFTQPGISYMKLDGEAQHFFTSAFGGCTGAYVDCGNGTGFAFHGCFTDVGGLEISSEHQVEQITALVDRLKDQGQIPEQAEIQFFDQQMFQTIPNVEFGMLYGRKEGGNWRWYHNRVNLDTLLTAPQAAPANNLAGGNLGGMEANAIEGRASKCCVLL